MYINLQTQSVNPDDMSPEDLAWSTPISEEWGMIYGRFIEDTEAMIQRGGGKQKVDVQSYGGDGFRDLGLHLVLSQAN